MKMLRNTLNIKKRIWKTIVGGAIIFTSLLPVKDLEAQNSKNKNSLSSNCNLEQTLKDNKKINVKFGGNLSNALRFWGMPFVNSPVYNQRVNFNYRNFLAFISGNVNIENKKLFMTNFGLKYSHSLSDKFVAYVGGTQFILNRRSNIDTAFLIYAGISARVYLNPSITYNRLNGCLGKGQYIEGSLSNNFNLNENVLFSSSVKLAYNNKALRNKKGISHLESHIELSINLSKKLDIIPYLNYVKSLTDDIKSGFYGGIRLNYKVK